jgi:hypothetical protein
MWNVENTSKIKIQINEGTPLTSQSSIDNIQFKTIFILICSMFKIILYSKLFLSSIFVLRICFEAISVLAETTRSFDTFCFKSNLPHCISQNQQRCTENTYASFYSCELAEFQLIFSRRLGCCVSGIQFAKIASLKKRWQPRKQTMNLNVQRKLTMCKCPNSNVFSNPGKLSWKNIENLNSTFTYHLFRKSPIFKQ